jgi:hypothetical protein
MRLVISQEIITMKGKERNRRPSMKSKGEMQRTWLLTEEPPMDHLSDDMDKIQEGRRASSLRAMKGEFRDTLSSYLTSAYQTIANDDKYHSPQEVLDCFHEALEEECDWYTKMAKQCQDLQTLIGKKNDQRSIRVVPDSKGVS